MNPTIRNTLIIGAIVLTGVIPVDEKNAPWLHSCSDLAFTTPSGWLEAGTYFEDGYGVQISTSDAPCAYRESYSNEEIAQSKELQTRLATLTRVEQTQTEIFADTFKDGNEILSEVKTKAEYEDLAEAEPRVPEKLVQKTLIETVVDTAEAAIVFSSTSTNSGSGTSLTYSHTTSGTDPFLVIGAFLQGNQTVSSITYGATTTTFGNGPILSASSGNEKIYTYYTVPIVGTRNVVINISGSVPLQGYSAQWTGVSGFDAAGNSSGCTTGLSCTATFTVAANTVTWVFYRNPSDLVTKSTNLSVDIFTPGSLGVYASGVNAGGSTSYVVTVTNQTASFPTALSAISFTASPDPVSGGTRAFIIDQ